MQIVNLYVTRGHRLIRLFTKCCQHMPEGAGQPMPVTFCGFLVACFVHSLLIKHSNPLYSLSNRILSSAHPLSTSNPRHMPGATLGWMSPGLGSTTSYTTHTDTRSRPSTHSRRASRRGCRVCKARSLSCDSIPQPQPQKF